MPQTDWVLVAQGINTVAYVITIIVGVVGNLWVSWKVGIVFLFGRKSLVPRNIIILILLICIADLLVLSHLILYVHFQIYQQWVFGSLICKSFYCIEVVNKLLIPLVLVQISRASYESVRLTQTLNKNRAAPFASHFYTFFGVCVVIALTVFVINFADTRTYHIPRKGLLKKVTVCSFHPPHPYEISFNILAFVFGYVFTSAAYVYFYLRVPILLKRRYSSVKTNSSTTRLNWVSILRIRRTVTAFVLVYMTCWTPYWMLFWFLSFYPVVSSWMVVISTFTHLLPYVSCTAYPVILTAINKGIRSAHSTIMSSQRKKFNTIREGAYQMITTQLGVVQTWLREDNRQTDNSRRFRWSSSAGVSNEKTTSFDEVDL
ncbi:unnamed protein product [Caenorhabditis bovis]|uniref:G-protein coupled receptors family 1 profile domain-containing protein n=1 Tax=Caenorhabditis bovis TaxID=2654633 RepID=A0A8S1EVV2_9PELO|nr:unnamed protein product [Caenorhabditis bovis]